MSLAPIFFITKEVKDESFQTIFIAFHIGPGCDGFFGVGCPILRRHPR
jgi:hypothetical protein